MRDWAIEGLKNGVAESVDIFTGWVYAPYIVHLVEIKEDTLSTWMKRMEAPVHGDNPQPFEMVLTYAVGVLAGVFLVGYGLATGIALSFWQMGVLFLVALDVVSGIVANATQSTNAWYRRRALWVRLLFIVVHFMHPLLAMIFVDPGNWTFFWGVYLYMIATTLTLLFMPSAQAQRPLAFAFFAVGVFGAIYLLPTSVLLQWFAPAYFAKLILAFAVDHYDTRAETQEVSQRAVGAARHA